jgi:hypothetical protein
MSTSLFLSFFFLIEFNYNLLGERNQSINDRKVNKRNELNTLYIYNKIVIPIWYIILN